MKIFKCALSVILICAVCCSLSGCGKISKFVDEQNADFEYVENISKEIVRCFDEKDIESLKLMFCANSQQKYDLDEEIQTAFELYNDHSKSYIVTNKYWTGSKNKDGNFTDKHFHPNIKIETQEGNIYNIGFYVYEIYEYDKGEIGIGAIGLEDENEKSIGGIGGHD